MESVDKATRGEIQIEPTCRVTLLYLKKGLILQMRFRDAWWRVAEVTHTELKKAGA